MRSRFTTSKFCDCIIDGLKPALDTAHETCDSGFNLKVDDKFNALFFLLLREAITEREDGL